MTERESPILSRILRTLWDHPHVLVVRVQSGKLRVGNHWVNLAPAGTPDFITLVRGGLWHGLEVKAADGKLSPVQETFHARVRELKGSVDVVRSEREAVDSVETVLWHARQREGSQSLNK